MVEEEEARNAILKVLKFNPRGLTVTDISKKTRYNRNSASKQLGILRAEGKVAVRNIGNARVFSLAQRVPLSAFLCFTRNMILILDDSMTVVQANDQYAGLTGLTKQELIGQNIIGSSLPIMSDPETLEIIRSTEKEQVITDIRFRKGKDELFYKMEVIPTTFEAGETGLTIVLEDITEKKRHLKNMEFLARTAMELVDLPPETDIYQYIAERLVELVPDNPRYYVFLYDDVKGEFFWRAVKSEAVHQGFTELIGYDPIGTKWPMKEFFYAEPFFENAATFKEMRIMHFKPFYDQEEYSVYDACARQFPQEVCKGILLKFNIAKIYLTGLAWQDQLFGMVGIGLSRDEALVNRQAIEAFFRQASIAMARRMTEERLARSEQRFSDLLNTMHLPATVITPDGRVILTNNQFTEMSGYSRDDIPTRAAFFETAFPDPEYRQKADAYFHQENGDENPIPGIMPMRCKNGEIKNVVFQPLRLSDGTWVVTFDVKTAH